MEIKKHTTIPISASIPTEYRADFINNYKAITQGTGRLFLFAADQKMEHLHKDFYGTHVPQSINSPEYLFELATSKYIGAFATHLGLITCYAHKYPNINYIAKLNGKTPLIPTDHDDPISRQLWTIKDVIDIKRAGVTICGVGYTIYIGSKYESIMLHEASKIIHKAHRAGLVTLLWIYPRGQAVKDERDGMLLAGAAGIAASLGSDFVKIKPPVSDNTHTSAEWINIAHQAAGTTNVICSGEEHTDVQTFFERLHEQLHVGHAGGTAIGRNIFQRPKHKAEKFMQAVAALVYHNVDVATALKIVKGS